MWDIFSQMGLTPLSHAILTPAADPPTPSGEWTNSQIQNSQIIVFWYIKVCKFHYEIAETLQAAACTNYQ